MSILVVKHIACEGLGLWQEFFSEKEIKLEIVELQEVHSLPPPERYKAVFVLGGPMNVYEEDAYPFLKEEDRFIKRALERGVPFVGFCLGAQLLAKALGAKITQNPAREIGWFEVSLTEQGRIDPMFDSLSECFEVFQWHGDTFTIPEGAVRLAVSKLCKNQAFRYGKTAYGFQFHVEIKPDMVSQWVTEYSEDLSSYGSAKGADIIAETHLRFSQTYKLSKRIFDNFCKVTRI